MAGPAPSGARGRLGIGVLSLYAWSLLSMLTTLVGTTLLSFRLQPTLTVLLTAAGAFGFIEVTRAIGGPLRTAQSIPVAAAIGLIGAIGFSQDIPDVLRPDLTVAYTDTDGNGAARRPPATRRREVLPRGGRRHPAGHRQAPRRRPS